MTASDSATPLSIIFAGTPEFAAQHLAALLNSHHRVIGVYTQPDRPSGRGKRLTASPVKTLAALNGLPVYQPASLKSSEEQQFLAQLNADLMVVVAYGLILPQAVLDSPRLGCINVHASLLPRWRGAAPIQRAIEAGDRETGITLMQMDAGLDTGDMLVKAHCAIDNEDTGGSLHDKLAAIGSKILPDTLDKLASRQLVAEQQENHLATYANKLTKDEALLDWSRSAQDLHNQIRAFNPFPVAFTSLNKERIRVWQARVASTSNHGPAGTILDATREGLLVACGQGNLLITSIQLPGKKCLPVSEVIKGQGQMFTIGNCFQSTADL